MAVKAGPWAGRDGPDGGVVMKKLGWIVGAALFGCGDSGGEGTTDAAEVADATAGDVGDTSPGDTNGPVTCAPAQGGRGEKVACVSGAVVDGEGAPIVGIKVSACTTQTCIISPTGADGRYAIQGLPVEPHRMEALGVPKGYMTIEWFQDTTAGVMTEAPHAIVAVPLTGAAQPLPESGGTALLADGTLELTVGADVLVYPIGAEEEVEAAAVAIEDLPPYDVAPWTGKEAASRAFVVNPFALGVEGELGLKVKGVGAAAGARYHLYTADHLTGRLDEGGTLVADDAGDLVLQPGATADELTTVVVVPE